MTMKQVIQTLKRMDGERRIPALRLEIDYELEKLYKSMICQDDHEAGMCKERLVKLRQELMRLEA